MDCRALVFDTNKYSILWEIIAVQIKPFRDFILEDLSKKKSAKQPYLVVRHDSPTSSKVTHSTTIHAANKAELHGHVRTWMDKIGLDPDDEDDHSHIKITAK
jgi:nicotinic acid phosphoribosyltransferase